MENKERVLPPMKKGEELNCTSLHSEEHNTKPPARYTEASLVKSLEENGIGRPSTFASIMGTIVKRGYVDRKSGKLIPTFLGLAVTQLLEQHFTNLVNKKFTAITLKDPGRLIPFHVLQKNLRKFSKPLAKIMKPQKQ